MEIIASSVVTTRVDLESFIKSTLFYSEQKFQVKYFDDEYFEQYLKQTRSGKGLNNVNEEELDIIGRCMYFLEHYEFIRLHFDEDSTKYLPTRLGQACLGILVSIFFLINSFDKIMVIFQLHRCRPVMDFFYFLSFKKLAKISCWKLSCTRCI